MPVSFRCRLSLPPRAMPGRGGAASWHDALGPGWPLARGRLTARPEAPPGPWMCMDPQPRPSRRWFSRPRPTKAARKPYSQRMSTSRRRPPRAGWGWPGPRRGRGARRAAPARRAGWSRPDLWPAGSDQAAVGGPAGQLVAAGELELSQDRGDVGLHRLHRQVQPAGHLLVGVAPGDVPQDLLLPGGELVQIGVDRSVEPSPEGVEHEPGEARREDRVAVADPADGCGQVGRGD